MPTLFDPLVAGDLQLANRIVMAPLTRNRSPGGVPQSRAVVYYTQRASAGLLVSEGVAISQQGQGYADVPGLYAPEQIEAWKRVTAAVHAAGGRIVAQIWHVGRASHDSLQPNGQSPVAPSAIRANSKTYLIDVDGNGGFVETSQPRALEKAEIPGVVDDYRKAARAAIEAGFDGVEIHGANGYLVDQFLRSSSNQRSDEYGGRVENRTRFLDEVVAAVAGEIGGGRTGIRLSPVTPSNDVSDPDPQPLFEHAVRLLAKHGLAFVHVIEGATGGPRDNLPFDYAALKQAYRNVGGRGAWIVNNGYTGETAVAAVASGYADAVAFGKAYISNPDLVRRLREKAPLNAWDVKTFYGGGDHGYIDYPTLD